MTPANPRELVQEELRRQAEEHLAQQPASLKFNDPNTHRLLLVEDDPVNQEVSLLILNDACLDAGMDDFISKPVVPDKLHEIVLNWLSQGRR